MQEDLNAQLIERDESMIIEVQGHTFRTVREDAYYYILKDIKTGIFYYVLYDEGESIIDEVHDLSHELNIEPLELTETLGLIYEDIDSEYSGTFLWWQDEIKKKKR